MNYKVEISSNFIKEAKKLSKKYNSLKLELKLLGESLSNNPTQGISLGNNVYKVRMTIASKAKGKSGGARIITFVKVENEVVYLLSIYNKRTKDVITDKEILTLLQDYL